MSDAAPGAIPPATIRAVRENAREIYRRAGRPLPFHGWHHVEFVCEKSLEFAARNGSDISMVEVAALVHDLNYLVERNSHAAAGEEFRQQLLRDSGVASGSAREVERIVQEAETRKRDASISLEAQALSDADTLFKVLPITPVMLAHRYLAETGVDLQTLAKKVVTEQIPLRDRGIYFYDAEAADRYRSWASANLSLWQAITEAIADPAVQRLLAVLAADEPPAGA